MKGYEQYELLLELGQIFNLWVEALFQGAEAKVWLAGTAVSLHRSRLSTMERIHNRAMIPYGHSGSFLSHLTEA